MHKLSDTQKTWQKSTTIEILHHILGLKKVNYLLLGHMGQCDSILWVGHMGSFIHFFI